MTSGTAGGSQLRTIAYDASDARSTVPTTVPAVTRIEIVKATGKLVSSHAFANPEKSIGAGSENALPSTACSVVFSDIEIVT